MDIVRHTTHDFYVKPHPRQKSGHAVVCASAAPMPLYGLICHVGINMNHCSIRRGWGGVLLQ